MAIRHRIGRPSRGTALAVVPSPLGPQTGAHAFPWPGPPSRRWFACRGTWRTTGRHRDRTPGWGVSGDTERSSVPGRPRSPREPDGTGGGSQCPEVAQGLGSRTSPFT